MQKLNPITLYIFPKTILQNNMDYQLKWTYFHVRHKNLRFFQNYSLYDTLIMRFLEEHALTMPTVLYTRNCVELYVKTDLQVKRFI